MTADYSSRPGPRTDLDARPKLIETAERLFGQAGVQAISLRAIGREAGLSSAGVLYHFPTKPVLVSAVVRRRSEELGALIRKNIQALLETGEPLGTRPIVDAVLTPMVELINSDPVGGLNWFKLFSELAHANDEAWVAAVQTPTDLAGLFREAVVRAVPDVDSEDARVRLSIAMFSMLTSLANADRGNIGSDGCVRAAFVEQLARFTAAGIAAD